MSTTGINAVVVTDEGPEVVFVVDSTRKILDT